MPQSSPDADLLARMLGIAEHYADAGDRYQLDRLRCVAREYADAVIQLRRALTERERLKADLAALDDRLACEGAVSDPFRRAFQ